MVMLPGILNGYKMRIGRRYKKAGHLNQIYIGPITLVIKIRILNPNEKICVDNLAEEAVALIVAETSHIPIPITRRDLDAIVWALQIMSNLLKFDQIMRFPF